MFARATLRVTDVDASARLYDTVLALLGRERSAGAAAWGDFAVGPGPPPVHGPDHDGNGAEVA